MASELFLRILDGRWGKAQREISSVSADIMGDILKRASKLSAKGIPFSNLLTATRPDELGITKTLVSNDPFSVTPSAKIPAPVAALSETPAAVQERTLLSAGVGGLGATLSCIHRLIGQLSKGLLARLHTTWELMTVENTIPLLFLSAMLALLMHRFRKKMKRSKDLALPPNEWLHIDNKPYATD